MSDPVRGRGRLALRVALCAALLAGAVAAAGPAPAVAATSPKTVWLQSMGACATPIPGDSFQLNDGTLSGVGGGTAPPVVTTACPPPAQRGSCGTIPTSPSTGCVTLAVTLPVAPATTKRYTITQLTTEANHRLCNGGSACHPPELGSLTIDSTGAVTATVTNTNPDGSTTQSPTGSTYSGTQADPVLFHDYGLGPGICDGDNDLDDALWISSGAPTSVCDDYTESNLPAPNSPDFQPNLAIGVIGTNGSLYNSATSFGPLASRGGVLIGSPAVVRSAAGVAYVGTGTDHALWVRSDTSAWQPLSPTAPAYCLGGPAAYVSKVTNQFWVACRGSDNALWYATAPGPTTSGALPSVASWSSLGGILIAAPAIAGGGPGASAPDDPTFFVIGGDNNVWLTTKTSNFTHLGGQCLGHPAAAVGNTAGTPEAFIACEGVDGNLWYGFFQSGAFSGFKSAASTNPTIGITDGPAIAGTPAGALFFVKSASDLGIYVKAVSAGQVSRYQRFGLQFGVYQLAYGPGAAN